MTEKRFYIRTATPADLGDGVLELCAVQADAAQAFEPGEVAQYWRANKRAVSMHWRKEDNTTLARILALADRADGQELFVRVLFNPGKRAQVRRAEMIAGTARVLALSYNRTTHQSSGADILSISALRLMPGEVPENANDLRPWPAVPVPAVPGELPPWIGDMRARMVDHWKEQDGEFALDKGED